MKTWLLILLLPPLVLLLPWAVPLWKGRRGRALLLFGLWLAAWAVLLWVAFGPGLIGLLVLGVGQLLPPASR
jgi:hypothetical protein